MFQRNVVTPQARNFQLHNNNFYGNSIKPSPSPVYYPKGYSPVPQGEQGGYHFPNNYRPPIQSLTAGPGGFEGTLKHNFRGNSELFKAL